MIKQRKIIKNSSDFFGGFFSSRYTLMMGIALLLVAVGLLTAPLFTPTAAPADPAVVQAGSLLASSGTTSLGGADLTIANMQKRIQSNEADYKAWASLGLAYQQKARETNDPGYYGEAEKAFQKSLQIKPDDYEALAGLGALDLSRHNFKEAQGWGRKAVNVLPDRAYAYGVIGDGQIEMGNYDLAVATFQKMVDLRPDLSSYSRVSYARELYGDVPGAIDAMQRAVAAGGPVTENTAWCRVQLGTIYFNSNKLPEAEKMYNEALATYPNYLHAQAGLAQVMWSQGKTDEAIKLYKQSVANVPLPQYVTALGDIYTSIGDNKAAKEQYDLVGYIYTLFEKNGVNVNMEESLFLADHDMDLVGALQKAEVAGRERQDVHTLDTLAWVRYKNGRYDDALKAEKSAMCLGTQNALFYYHLGMIQNKLGQTDEARKSVQKALDINPYFSPLYSPQAAAFVKQ